MYLEDDSVIDVVVNLNPSRSCGRKRPQALKSMSEGSSAPSSSSSAALIGEMAVQPRGTVLQQRAISSLTACALKSNYTNLLILVNKEAFGPNKPGCLSSGLKNNKF